MYSPFKLTAKYLAYKLRAANEKGHSIHSPFVFEFVTRVLNDKKKYPEYKRAEALRKHFLKDTSNVIVNDFGAGSYSMKGNKRSIRSIAQNSAKPPKFGQLLFRMARYYHSIHILELGTSLGITTSYLSLAQPASKLVTLEGAKEVATVAKKHFAASRFQNISLIEGNFDDTLQQTLQELKIIDLAFIDGNHRRDPTLKYFLSMLPHINNNSLFVFDDIHWSNEMEEAWHTIKNHPLVRCTIDLFFVGIVVFRSEFREKQHFVIRF
jgi:predicted O-methyltransferase YrrM